MKVLITGGTGSVGAELIKRFSVNDKFEIWFTYHSNAEKANLLSQQYHCKAIQVEDIANDFDIIINNAGIVNSLVSCEDVSLENWEETIRVNLTLPFTIIRKNLHHMKDKGWGRIINISSIYGVRAEEDVTPYTVSKHGLIGLTKSVAKEYAQYGITCNAICPGTIVSELSERLASYYTSNEVERQEYFEELNNAIPAKRLVYPKEIADFAYFIASEEAAYINGATLMIDGGYTV
jgi:NAD(P)-dependent dehydrogenase (short-subunit alcohol dehydrogenase family)